MFFENLQLDMGKNLPQFFLNANIYRKTQVKVMFFFFFFGLEMKIQRENYVTSFWI